jgi:ring-1,2-phenylacetyl-CoA epoxidase subunit PaaC
MLRQLYFSVFMQAWWREAMKSTDETLRRDCRQGRQGRRLSRAPRRRMDDPLGDGTEESARRMAEAVEALWPYTGELFETDAVTKAALRSRHCARPGVAQGRMGRDHRRGLRRSDARHAGRKPGSKGRPQGAFTARIWASCSPTCSIMQRAYPGLTW